MTVPLAVAAILRSQSYIESLLNTLEHQLKIPDHANKTVLLIDEIDKAEPDLPNDLLEPLDRRRFSRPDGKHVEAGDDLEILTIITTNRERELPAAFMRRCVSLVLKAPDESKLQTIAHHHFPDSKNRLDNNRVLGIGPGFGS